MTFTIEVKTDYCGKTVKDECCAVLAKYLNKKGVYFSVGYDPNELDVDNIGKA